jgi:excisionase family DNA binding protein
VGELELLNTEQAAAVLQVTPGTLMVWRCTKRYPLRFIRVGRLIRYRASDLEAFLAARTMSGVSSDQPIARTRTRATRRLRSE